MTTEQIVNLKKILEEADRINFELSRIKLDNQTLALGDKDQDPFSTADDLHSILDKLVRQFKSRIDINELKNHISNMLQKRQQELENQLKELQIPQ